MSLTNPLKRSFVWERQLTFGPFDAVPASKRERLHGIHRTIFHSCSSIEVNIKIVQTKNNSSNLSPVNVPGVYDTLTKEQISPLCKPMHSSFLRS
jgi:hypothetical protein